MTEAVSKVAKTQHVTTLLLAWGGGDRDALDQLVPLVHEELRRRARRAMFHERADHSLQPTALVNEVYCGWSTWGRFSGTTGLTFWRWRPA